MEIACERGEAHIFACVDVSERVSVIVPGVLAVGSVGSIGVWGSVASTSAVFVAVDCASDRDLALFVNGEAAGGVRLISGRGRCHGEICRI